MFIEKFTDEEQCRIEALVARYGLKDCSSFVHLLIEIGLIMVETDFSKLKAAKPQTRSGHKPGVSSRLRFKNKGGAK